MPQAPRPLKLPPRFAGMAFAFYMSAIVALIMTITLTALRGSIGADFVAVVLRGYAVAWPVAFVSVMAVRPVVLRLVGMTVAPPER